MHNAKTRSDQRGGPVAADRMLAGALGRRRRQSESRAIDSQENLAPLASVKKSWTCSGCDEKIEGQFSECWNCGCDRAGVKVARRGQTRVAAAPPLARFERIKTKKLQGVFMEYRQLGNSGVRVSVVGLGTNVSVGRRAASRGQ